MEPRFPALQRLQLELDTVQATINGLRRMIQDGPQAGVVREPGQLKQLEQELKVQQAAVQQYREQMAQLRQAIEAGRVQAGFGDRRFAEDDQVRRQFKQLLWQEVKLAQGGAGGSDLGAYAKLLLPLLRKADATDTKIDRAMAVLDRRIGAKRVMLLGGTCVFVGVLALTWAHSLAEVIAYRLLSGGGMAMWGIARHAYIAGIIQIRSRGRSPAW